MEGKQADPWVLMTHVRCPLSGKVSKSVKIELYRVCVCENVAEAYALKAENTLKCEDQVILFITVRHKMQMYIHYNYHDSKWTQKVLCVSRQVS